MYSKPCSVAVSPGWGMADLFSSHPPARVRAVCPAGGVLRSRDASFSRLRDQDFDLNDRAPQFHRHPAPGPASAPANNAIDGTAMLMQMGRFAMGIQVAGPNRVLAAIIKRLLFQTRLAVAPESPPQLVGDAVGIDGVARAMPIDASILIGVKPPTRQLLSGRCVRGHCSVPACHCGIVRGREFVAIVPSSTEGGIPGNLWVSLQPHFQAPPETPAGDPTSGSPRAAFERVRNLLPGLDAIDIALGALQKPRKPGLGKLFVTPQFNQQIGQHAGAAC